MKIEKINENQIKCTLTRSDLASRQLKLSELAYGTEKANGLFRDMMDQASLEFGFDASDIPLMIEAIPISMDCIILMITKVEDPDEIDTRFSTLSNLREMFDGDTDEYASDVSDIQDANALSLLAELTENALQHKNSAYERLYSFTDLDTVIDLAHHISGMFKGESTLYKSPEDGRFYLLLNGSSTSGDFAYICTAALEFGCSEPVSFARKAYMDEHFEKILDENAVQSLAYV